jgi:hypothetical protein
MRSSSDVRPHLVGIGLVALVATVVVHVMYVPRYLPAEFTRGLPYLVVGWGCHALFFYALGRSRPPGTRSRMPNMRVADIGVALFLGSIVVSGLLDTAGLTVAGATTLHVPSAAGIYVGLALSGWGFGRRTRLVNELASEKGTRDP